MKSEILTLISKNIDQNFVFFKCESDSDAIKELNIKTIEVPESDGIYFVFAPIVENRNIYDHLIYNFYNVNYEFIYFGVSGGKTADGKEGVQKLRKRINNVVGGDNKKFISRAVKWNNTLVENNFLSFIVFYVLNAQPKNIEDKIYSYLKANRLKYPLLNKKRGRPAKII